MDMRTRALAMAAAAALGGFAVQAAAAPTAFFFDQRAGFDDDSLTIFGSGVDVNFSNPLPAGYPADTFADMDWEFNPGDPGDPSALNITTFSDAGQGAATGGASPLGDTNGDGLWNSSEWWTITRLTQTNNEISGDDVPLWFVNAIANLTIFADAAHTTVAFDDPGDVTGIEFNETLNEAPAECNQANPHGTGCDDFYVSMLGDFAQETFEFLGEEFALDFRILSPDGSAIIQTVGDELRIFTAENFPGVSVADIQMHWEPIAQAVPEPGTLALIGLGLAGIGFIGRGKRA